MSRFTILLAGPIEATSELLAEVAGTRVIAADAGIRHAGALKVVPELWVGDFDSHVGEPDLVAVPRRTWPRDKDRTDGEIAIAEAWARGASSLLVVGAFGGRSDHAFSHLVIALRESEAGRDVVLFDGREWGYPLPLAPRRFAARRGAQFSILKFSDLGGLTIEGARFPLDRADIPFASILTQSNEALGDVTVDLRKGRALLLLQADPLVR
ncbi:thiamine diphosphokinase [Aureimonas sp. ME7]|uniref:thiamine diphosphokinase n=1 Tax=Aureimonas sp. ME7 TaxID=2744252 RepID=UPI0015F49FC9|nr:thiamine diphosphokinase [Aureimonas sp. ME7]